MLARAWRNSWIGRIHDCFGFISKVTRETLTHIRADDMLFHRESTLCPEEGISDRRTSPDKTVPSDDSNPFAEMNRLLIKMTQELEHRSGMPPSWHPFVTQIFRCNQIGFPHSWDPYYQEEFDNEEEAHRCHASVVESLAAGRLALRRRKGRPS